MPINSVHVSSFFHRSFGTMIFVVFISVLFNCCECVCKTVVGEVNVISTFGHFFECLSPSPSIFLSCLPFLLSVLFAYGESTVVNITATNVWRSHYTSACLYLALSLYECLFVERVHPKKHVHVSVYVCFVCVFANDGCFFFFVRLGLPVHIILNR